MKRFAPSLLYLIFGLPAFASTSNMTATVTDTDGTAWANCSYMAKLTILGGTSTPAPTIGGVTVSPLVVKGSCSNAGVIAATLTDTNSVDQKNVQWVFQVQPNASSSSVTVSTPVIGASPSLTSAFSILAPPRFATGSSSYGYADVEIQGVPLVGATYYNVTTPCFSQFSLAGWTCGGGGGGGGGASFPSTAGVVCNTSTTASTNCLPGQLASAIGTTSVASAVTSINTNDTRVATALTTANTALATANAALPRVGTVLTAQIPSFEGTVVPVFQTVGSFDNLGAALGNPFCLASGGGLLACTSGTLASGYRRLPREANTSRITRTDWQVVWDPTDTTGTMTLGIGLSTGKYNVTLSNPSSGTMQAVFASNGAGATTTISGAVGASPLTLTVSVVTGNGGVTLSVLPQGAQIAQANPDPWLTYQAVWQPMIQPRVTVAYFAASSTTSKIVGWLHNANGLDGDPNGVLLTRTAARNLAGTSNNNKAATAVLSTTTHENLIVIPERANPGIPLKSVMFFHGRTGYGPSDFCMVPGASTAAEPTDATCVALLAAGYAIVADQGGTGFTNNQSDYWGNIRGTQHAKETLDVFTKQSFNPGKIYALGQSMGGVSSLNFIRQYPNVIAAAYEATPAIDLNETSCPLGINCAGSSLQLSLNSTYQLTWLSLLNSNVGNAPATDSGTNWVPLAEVGALPDVGGLSPQKTTVSVISTNSPVVTLVTNVGFAPGDWIYFKNSRLLRRITDTVAGNATAVVVDSPVTVAVGDLVQRITKKADGSPDPNSFDFTWLNFLASTPGWVVGTTYNTGQIVYSPSSNQFADEGAWNPLHSPESFGITPVDIGIGGDGTCTGNDGILNNAQMCSFADAVNAAYPGLVTETHYAGTNGGVHVTQAMVPANILAFFAAH